MDAIVVEELRKRYGAVQALDGVSFGVREGEVFALLGSNGAGKSTFLAPAIVVMNAFFGATWSGMSMIADLEHKVVERFLATPASRCQEPRGARSAGTSSCYSVCPR